MKSVDQAGTVRSDGSAALAVGAAGLAAATIGILALLGWLLDAPSLTRWNAGTVPMAPSTAVLAVIFGAALGFCVRTPLSRGTFLWATIFGWAGMVAALLVFALRVLGIYWRPELLGMRIEGMFGGGPIGYISPITACGFLLSNAAFLYLLAPGPSRPWRDWFASGFGWLTAGTGFMFLVASAFGSPLLSGEAFIPPAINTSLVLLIMGLALPVLAGRWTGRPHGSPQGARNSRLVFVAVSAGFTAVTIAGGYGYYRHEELEVRGEVVKQLDAISRLKVRQVVQWREERLGDASMLRRSADISISVEGLLQRPDDAPTVRQAQAWLDAHRVHGGQNDRLFLIDSEGTTRLSAPGDVEPPSSVISRQAVEVLRTGHPSLVDFYVDERDQRPHMASLVPIRGRSDASQPLGVLALRIDPEPFLYPFLEGWPTPSTTSETLLVRREGSDVLYLTDLRFGPNATELHRVPLGNTRVLAVKAALGETGEVEGLDYRGEPAIGVLRSIPDSPWYLVTLIEVAEFRAALWERFWLVAALTVVLLVGGGSGIGLYWRDQAARAYQKRAELTSSLRESEERLRLALSAANQGLYDLDVQTGEEVVSPEYASMLGYDPTEFRETPAAWIDRLHPDDRDVVGATYREYLAGRRDEYRVEYRLRTKSGGWKWILALGKVVSRSADGQPLRMLGTHTDITARKTAEKALQQSEERYRRILETAQEGVWTFDAENRITFVNPKMAEMLGYSVEEMLGASLFDFMDEEARAVSEAGLTRRRAGVAERLELRYRRKDGSALWTLNNATPMMNDAGEYVGALGMVSDITDVKLANDRLSLQSAALDAAANAIVITDATGCIVWVNPAFKTLTGYGADEAVGRNPRDLVRSGVHDAAFYKDVWDTILAGHVWHGEMTNRRKDGSRYIEEQTITPLKNSGGHITHFISIKRDLTDQKQLQEQLLQAQKMEAIGQLAGGVAHDFNNTVTAILGYSEFLLSSLETEEQRADAGEIIKAGHRAAVLTRQLLAFSRKQVLQTTIVDVNAIVADVSQLLRPLIGEHIEFSTVAGADLPVVRVDAGQIGQVLMNLALNARDAMPEGGRLSIETAGVELDDTVMFLRGPARPGRYVRLTVADTGAGMTDDTKRRALDPFFTTKEVGKGTGLGLSTVDGIVQQSGGYLRIDSELGRGSTFTVYLPAANAEPADLVNPSPGKKPSGGTETVLLVEDEQAVRLLARTVLERAGYRVLMAANSAEAEAVFHGHSAPIDILLTDVVMPGGTGIDLYVQLAAKQPGLRAVFMSGYAESATVERARRVQKAGFLAKPFTVDEIVHSVRDALDR